MEMQYPERTPTLEKLGFTIEQALLVIKKRSNELEVNSIRYRDIQARLARTDQSTSRYAELVIKEQAHLRQRQEIVDDLNLLLKDFGKAINDPLVESMPN